MEQRKYHILLNNEKSVVELSLLADISKAEGLKAVEEARELAYSKNYNLLYDTRSSTLNIKMADFYFMVKDLPVLKNPKASLMKVAILAQYNDQKEMFKFYELVANNSGLNSMVFNTKEEAYDWFDKN